MSISSYLRHLEAESIYIMREVAAQFERPALLFSGGKDSIVLVHLAQRAFFPGTVPFTLVHVDTGHNFPETLEFRDKLVGKLGLNLVVRYVQDSIDAGRISEKGGPNQSRNTLQTVTLLDTIAEFKFDACIGGARRDEEKARAKERIFSHRDSFGQWDPKNQRPELWSLYNGRKQQGENFRVFPLSNWTEMDVWNYIQEAEIAVPLLYFAHQREVILRGGMWMATYPSIIEPLPGETPEMRTMRFRTIGDISCTAAVESSAATLDEVIREIATTRLTERASRADDKTSASAMEDRKKQGYF